MRFARAMAALGVFGAARGAHAEGPVHAAVAGAEIASVELSDPAAPGGWKTVAWDDLSALRVPRGATTLRLHVTAGAPPDAGAGDDGRAPAIAIEIPVCAGRRDVQLDGHPVVGGTGPLVAPLGAAGDHEVTIRIDVGAYEQRIACGAAPRVGTRVSTREGLGEIAFASPASAQALGGGHAVVYVPPAHDPAVPGALLVGLHPWNGGIWTYAAYAELLREAAVRDVVLLFPSGLGNSLYTAPAESEVVRAIDALSAQIAVDPRRVSIWGASMGGAGATTIGLHRPDRFAGITSFFGDAKYDLSTYVHAILSTEAAAHAVNALDVVDNARHVPVWLIHGEADTVSPIAQSAILARALTERHDRVRFDRVAHAGHEGALVAKLVGEVVARASEARAPEHPTHVTFRSVRATDTSAYGVRIVRAGAGDAFVDVEKKADGVHLVHASGVRAIVFARGALGVTSDAPPPVLRTPETEGVDVRWEAGAAGSAATP